MLEMRTLNCPEQSKYNGGTEKRQQLEKIRISIDSSSSGSNSCRHCYGFAFAPVNAIYYVGSRCRIKSIRLANAGQSLFSGVNQDLLTLYSMFMYSHPNCHE